MIDTGYAKKLRLIAVAFYFGAAGTACRFAGRITLCLVIADRGYFYDLPKPLIGAQVKRENCMSFAPWKFYRECFQKRNHYEL